MLDSEATRARGPRALLGTSIIVAIIVTCLMVGSALGTVWMILSIALAGFLVALVVPLITVYVPYTWGLVAENSFSGEPVVYGSGWHWSYPWEQVTEESNISLEERTSVHEGLTMATKTDEMRVKISFQWRPDLAHLAVFRRMDESIIKQGIFEPLERFISTLFAMMDAEQVKENQSVLSGLAFKAFKNANDQEAQKEIAQDNPFRNKLMQELKQFRGHAGGLEDSFGIYVVQVNISDIDYSDDVKEARAAKAEHLPLLELYYDIAGGEDAYKALSFEKQREIRKEARVLSGNATERQLNISGDSRNVLIGTDDK